MSKNKVTGLKKQALSILLILALAGLTLYLLSSQTNGLDKRVLFRFFRILHPWAMALCLVSMAVMVFAEGYSLKRIAARLGHPVSLRKATMWAASDYYFSGLTPCATGGQPAAVYFMHKDGIPVSKASAALVLNTLAYTLSLLAWGILCLLSTRHILRDVPPLAIGFLIYGLVTHVVLIAGCLLCMFRPALIRRIGNGTIALLAKLRLVKHPEKKRASLSAALRDYAEAVSIIRRSPAALLEIFAANMVQRFATVLPVCLLYLGIGGNPTALWSVYGRNILCLLSSAAVPVPGTVGISELMCLQYLGAYFGRLTVPAMLTNRVIVFYFCLLLCGLWTLLRLARLQKGGRRASAPPDTGRG